MCREGCEMNKDKLSCRKQEIIELIAEGMTNKEIAVVLNISEKTVKTYVKNIMLKLEVDNRCKIIAWYYKNLNSKS